MNNDDQVACIDVQQLNCKMATMTTSSTTVNTIQNSITEHVLSNELSNFVASNKLNSKNSSGRIQQQDTGAEAITSHTNLNESSNIKNINRPPIIDLIAKSTGDNSIDDLPIFSEQTSTNSDDNLILITNRSTIDLLKDNLNLIRIDYLKQSNQIDLNNTVDQSDDLNSSAQQLKEIFSTIRESISTNSTASTNTNLISNLSSKSNKCPTKSPDSKTELLIEKNFLFNQFYNSTGDSKVHGKLMDDENKQSNRLNNNNDGQCKVDECNQFNLNNHNQISKLITDDYLTEHDFNYLINTNHLQFVHNSSGKTQTSPKMKHHTLPDKSISLSNQTVEDEDEEVYEDPDNLIDGQQIKLNRPPKSDAVDIETMKNHLAKLKLSKDFDTVWGSPVTFTNSPLDELNDDNDNDYFDAIDEEIDRTPLIRSTSLKTGKSKSLEPENKKMVRFADAMGLDLAKIKNISQEDLPNVPASAFRDLKMCRKEVKEEFFNNQLSCSPVRSGTQINQWNQNKFASNKTPILSNGIVSATGSESNSSGNWPILVPEFVQPFTQFNFLERVRNQRVCLESCVVSSIGNNLSVDCIIRVQNISFEKSIMVRYTSNNWNTWLDSLASYIPNSCDGQTDRFSVKFYIKSLAKGQRVKFAIKYLANFEEFWDNNLGIDYCLLYKT